MKKIFFILLTFLAFAKGNAQLLDPVKWTTKIEKKSETNYILTFNGVIEKESHIHDSFNNNLLDYPVYTKPYDFRGMKVPDILLSGHHENIDKWRYEQSLKKTKEKRIGL